MRVLLIDGDRAFAESVAMSCINDGIAVRLAETLCEGVRYMMDGPVSVVLIDAALMRLSAPEQVQLFDAVAPGVPVAVLVPQGTTVEETVKLQVQGFQVVAKPVSVQRRARQGRCARAVVACATGRGTASRGAVRVAKTTRAGRGRFGSCPRSCCFWCWVCSVSWVIVVESRHPAPVATRRPSPRRRRSGSARMHPNSQSGSTARVGDERTR